MGQETIIAFKDNRLIKRDESKEFDPGEHGKGCICIMSDPDNPLLKDVVVYIPLPGSDKAHEVVISKALLKTYVREIR